MFLEDKAIEKISEDSLGRGRFSQHISEALSSWKGIESLVVAVFGQWGSGKSSVINLAKTFIDQLVGNERPTIINFNPWEFSEQYKLTEHFFNELSKEIKLKGNGKEDKKLALTYRKYSKILMLAPDGKSIGDTIIKFIAFASFIGLAINEFINEKVWLLTLVNYIVFSYWALVTFFRFIGNRMGIISEVLEIQSQLNEKSISQVKREIAELLRRRNGKLIIVIDDIDRLNSEEIRKMFALIRANADFPNVIYLLAFDRSVVEASLEEQKGVSGKDFLEKIIQVSFELPYVKDSALRKIFFIEFEKLLLSLPKSAMNYFGENDPYWANIYYSGFSEVFVNIRSIKRYFNSLRFNISLMIRDETMEVNPIDFMAIELIRVFAPDYYEFIKSNSSLFTSDPLREYSGNIKDQRKMQFSESLLLVKDQKLRTSVEKLARRLFPHVDGLYTNTIHSSQSSTWFTRLQICSPKRFDSYFTLVHGGEESELSEFEIQLVLNCLTDLTELERCFDELLAAGKFRKLLVTLQYYTSDDSIINLKNLRTLAIALFNTQEKIKEEEKEAFDFGPDMEVSRILYQVMRRSSNKQENYELLKDVIENTNGIIGPVYEIAILSQADEKQTFQDPIAPENLKTLQAICVSKIESQKANLLKNRMFLTILYRWKEWGGEEQVSAYLNEVFEDPENLFEVLSRFIGISRSYGMGDFAAREKKSFRFKDLERFVNIDEIRSKIEAIRIQDTVLYSKNIAIVELINKKPNLED